MILLDSCDWLEVFAATRHGELYRPALEVETELLVPTVCLLEVARRLHIATEASAAAEAAVVMMQGTVVPLDAALALEAARLGPALRLPCADSVIYATAQAHDAELWTHDPHFRDLPCVRFIEAPAG